ncbi:MAG: DNA-binding response regulator [Gammaproteobacteria bacterium]|nr:MAG: DNA-binding response regulator [Gammaproteobacteria bacterium]
MPEPADLLLVDDDPAYARALAAALAARGRRLEWAADADAACRLAGGRVYRGVLVDLRLGEDNALRCLPDLRRAQPEACILIVTGYASIATAVAAIKAGADDYLCKPVDVETLLAKLGGAGRADRAPPPGPRPSPRRLEWEYIQAVLAANGGNVSATARELGMHRRTLQRKLAKRPVRR